MWVDTMSSAAGLVTSATGLGTGDAAPWMKNVAIGSILGASSSEKPIERIAAVGLLSLAAFVTGARAKGRDRHVAGLGLALNDVVSWAGMHVAVSLYVAAHRRYARLQDEADELAVEQAEQAAAEAERSHQHSVVHRATIEVLKELSDCSDSQVAGAVAGREARRLRHILSTKGQMPSGLDRALYEVSEDVRVAGLQVELVTADLTGEVPADALASLRKALLISLLAAREFAAADRAVVRAVSDDDQVSVTVRHHSGGFAPGGGSLYEGRLAGLQQVLGPVFGRVEVWSQEERGVHVSLTMPTADPAAEPREHRSKKNLPLRDVAPAEVVTPGPSFAGIQQGELVGLGMADGRSSSEKVLERGSWRQNDDANRRILVHDSDRGDLWQLVAKTKSSLGQLGPYGVSGQIDEALRANRTIATLFMAWRCSGLATGFAALIAGRRRYRSRMAAVVQLAGAVVESVGLAWRLHRRGFRFDRQTQLTDASTAVGALLAGRANLPEEDLWTWINWAPWSFAASAVSGQALGDPPTGNSALRAATIILAGTALAARWNDRVVNACGMASCFAVGQVFVRQIRNGATRLEAARAEAIEEGRRLASEKERSRQLRLLHDSALQSLEAVGSGRYPDLNSVQSLARNEARRLEAQLVEPKSPSGSLNEAMDSVVDEHRGFGLAIDLTIGVVYEPIPPVLLALRDATSEALMNVRKHAGSAHVEVDVASSTDGVCVTVRDRGAGFDPTHRAGFGTVESIVRRMSDVGGQARIDSALGKGTTVILWGPA